MAEISRLSRLVSGVSRGVDLASNTLVVDIIKLGGAAGTTLSKTQLDAMLAHYAGDGSDHQDVVDLVSLSGVAANSSNLGAFTGTTIPDAQTIKQALQALESAVETATDDQIATEVPYTPTTGTDWVDPDPTEVGGALDDLAARVTVNDAKLTADTTNVAAAGAVMKSGSSMDSAANITFSGNGEVLGLPATPSATGATSKEYVDAQIAATVASEMTFKGDYNAATNTPDLDTTPIATAIGDMYVVTAAGNFFTAAVQIGDVLIAKQASATLESHWTIVNKNLDAATDTTSGTVELATIAEVDAGTDSTRAITPAALAGSALQTKVDGIESGATADQTGAEIKSLYEAEANTNAFTDAEQTKVGFLTVTQAVDLDTMESDIAGLTDGSNADAKHKHSSLTDEGSAGETLTAGLKALRYAKAADVGFVAGRLYFADIDASAADNFHVVGLATTAGETAGTNIAFTKAGKMTAVAHGFTVGEPIYLSSTGALTNTAPSAADQAVVKVGVAVSANTIEVQIQIMGVN